MSATSGGGGSVSEGSEAGGSSQSTMSVGDSPSTSFQANLASENVTKITLSEDTSPGGYAVDATGSKINLTLDERQQQKDGIVNVAFDYEEGGNRGSGGGGGGGEHRSMNGSEKKDKVPEAVNLELVNMVPYSNGNGTSYGVPVNGIPGIPMKKDSETVDMSTPYDEYFVPVNEHKKYMRGEKLYVTKDKRRPTSWRRCLSWVVACTVISVVLIVAILAGTGVILSQEPDLVKDASIGRNFAGSDLKPSVTDKSATPTAEKLMYVPRSIESEFVIDNLDFDPAFRDVNSSAYQQFAASMENQLKMLLFDKETLEFGASDIGVRVVNISRDPFKVNYRIGWNYKQGANNPPEPIKMEDVKRRLVESLARNQGYIDKYHIDREAIKVNHVINACQIENGGCSHICYYNYITQRFTCTCPTHLVLDGTGKNCVAWSGSEDDVAPVPSHGAYPETPYESTANPAQEYEHKSSFQHDVYQGVHHQHDHEHGVSTDSEFKGHLDQQHGDHEPSAEPIPEPTAEPNPGQPDKSSVDFEVKPEPTPEPNIKGIQDEEQGRGMHSIAGGSQYEHDEHHVHSSEETSGPEVAPEPTAEPNSEGRDRDYVVHSVYGSEEPSPEPSPEPAPAPEPAPEPGSDTTQSKDHIYNGHSLHDSKDHEPAAGPTPEPAPEPTAEPTAEGKDHEHSSQDHEPTAEPIPGNDSVQSVKETEEPVAEPTTGQSGESKGHAVYSFHDLKDHEPSAEPTVEPSPEIKDHEPAAEPTPEPVPEPTAEENAEEKDHTLHSSFASVDREPTAEPTAEPAPEPTAEDKNHEAHAVDGYKHHETAGETTPRPTDQHQDNVRGSVFVSKETEEPTAEPSPDSHSVYASKDNEPVAEPTAEPSPESEDKYYQSAHETESTEATRTHNYDSQDTAHGFTGPDHMTEHTSEPAPEPTPEPSSDDELQTHSPNTGSGEHIGITSQSHDPLNSEPYSKGSNREQMQVTGFSTKHDNPNEAHPENEHRVEHLQDVLIKRPDSDSEKNNGTQNVLQNVERTANGEPVIEEVIIDKAKEQGESKTSPDTTTDDKTNTENQSEPSHPSTDGPFKSVVLVMGSSSEKSIGESAMIHESSTPGGSNSAPETVTEGLASAEQSTTPDGREISKVWGYSENPTNRNQESGTKSQVATVGGNVTPHSENRTDSESKLTNPDNVPGTTVQPERQSEFHTIPVAVEFLSSTQHNGNMEGKAEQANQTESPDSNAKPEDVHATEKASFDRSEGTTETGITLNGDEQSSGGSGQVKAQETTTESHMPTTTLPTSPGNVNGQSNVVGTNQSEVNESTKSPEEISNNIKDELLDNEAFNTLIEKEYGSTEGGTTDGNEAISKYPTKGQKTEKKRIKDVKGEKGEVTARPGVTPEDFILQKHVNGHENVFDLDYSIQKEQTTKPEGEVTVIDPHGIDGVPGMSFKPHGVSNHDLRVLQTVAPDFRTETAQTYESESQKPESKVKVVENREGEAKQDKDYGKPDKDYKYEKQKVSKKKGDLKKKGGSGKDGKNVELDDGRKYLTEVSKEDFETSQEIVKDLPETTVNPSFEKVTDHPGMGARPGPPGGTIEYGGYVETTRHPNQGLEKKTETAEGSTEHPGQSRTEETGPQVFGESFPGNSQERPHVDQNNHQIIDEPSVKTTSNVSPGTVYDGQFSYSVNATDPNPNPSPAVANTEIRGGVTPGTVFDGMQDSTTPPGLGVNTEFGISGSSAGAATHGTSLVGSKVATDEGGERGNVTDANPTIVIHGQSGNLQDGHIIRFANSAGSGNFSRTFAVPVSQTFTNFTTFPNGSAVHPTIIIRGQSGALQNGHEIRFSNATFVTSFPNGQHIFKNATVHRIENGSLPDTVFDGQFTPQNGHYHMFTNSSGTFVYSNVTTQPTFIIKGEGGDFGSSRGYIMANGSGSTFYGDLTSPSVIFRNSTVFAIGNTPGRNVSFDGFQQFTVQPHGTTSNETIHYTRQVSPNFFSTGTAYKVNNYFGYISKCAAGQFQCVNGTSKRGSACISLSSKCDSINDCSDGSDELGCVENGCPGNFQCSDGSCLKRNLVCNGILDCSDGSDEKQCESWKCEFDEFQCPSGRCIPVVWQCDGKPDCDNHTDEYNCQTSCGNDEYLCPEGWCVPLTYKCNGVKECSNGEDEQLCDCSHEEFKCQTGGCVSSIQVCDGLDDCPDRSDEWDCVKLEPGSNLLKIRTASGDYEPVCADDWTSRHSDEVCASLGYFSAVPIENENSSSITTERSFFALKNDSTDKLNKKIIVNLRKSEGKCSSGKLVEVACQEFSCGSRSMTDSSSVEARLVGGMSATAGQWPSVALLYNIRNFHSCTANILTPRWVLASYNCLKMGNKNLNEQDWKFFGGSTVFEAERENAETRKILSIVPHPQVKFNQFVFSNDLALVELDRSLQFTSNLGAVCLPEQEMQPRQICIAAGWGMNAPEDKFIRQQLQYLPVPTMNLTECNSTEHYSGFITEDKICAGYNSGQKSLCYNEEGAPLMCVNDRLEWELQGVLSYHSNCGRGSHPSIFSSITPVVDWIKKTIGNAFERKQGTTKR